MVSFPWKQKIERSGIPSSSARQKKSGQPLDKKLMIRKSSDSFLISNKKSKPSSEAVQENYRHSRRGSVLVCTPFLANHALLCLKFPQTRKPENLSTIFQENRRPWRRFVLPAKTKHVAVSCSGPQRGQRVRAFFSSFKFIHFFVKFEQFQHFSSALSQFHYPKNDWKMAQI